MNDKNKNFERRVNQRYDVQLPLNIGTEGFQFESTTKNISCAGVYCQIDFFLPLMTKLEVTMKLSVIENDKKVEKTFMTNTVIVRIDPEYDSSGCDEYHAALFFMGLKDEYRNIIASYIQQTFLASNN
ncbi:MAG: PilZ domain-containing protein [Candidatus Omnitrophica bacterium]|nr:PilZ domain-containing protein [Candidatus Omnitrophota bacterium]